MCPPMHPTSALHIVFATNPDSPDLTFVEVENDRSESVSVGEWSDRDGYKVLTIQPNH